MPTTPKTSQTARAKIPNQQISEEGKALELGSTLQSLPIASPARRLAALLYDLLLLAAISLAYSAIILIARVLINDSEAAQQSIEGPLRYIFLAGWWLSLALFYCWCWRRSGQTLGMKTWHLRLEQDIEPSANSRPLTNGGINYKPASWRQCWLRCLVAPPVVFLFGITYIYCLFNRKGHCLHDIWSQTRVVVLPKEKSRQQLKRAAAARKPNK